MKYKYIKHRNEKDRAGILLEEIEAYDILEADKIFQERTGLIPAKNMSIGVIPIFDKEDYGKGT